MEHDPSLHLPVRQVWHGISLCVLWWRLVDVVGEDAEPLVCPVVQCPLALCEIRPPCRFDRVF